VEILLILAENPIPTTGAEMEALTGRGTQAVNLLTLEKRGFLKSEMILHLKNYTLSKLGEGEVERILRGPEPPERPPGPEVDMRKVLAFVGEGRLA